MYQANSEYIIKRCRSKCTVGALYSQDLRDKHAQSFVYAVADHFLLSALMPARIKLFT